MRSYLLIFLFLFFTFPSAVRASPPSGYLDVANDSVIAGWARDPDHSGSIWVSIYIDNILQHEVIANINRSDVGGNYGFHWDYEGVISGTHQISVMAKGVNSAGYQDSDIAELIYSPMTINKSSAESLDGCGTWLLNESFETGQVNPSWISHDLFTNSPRIVDSRQNPLENKTHGYYYLGIQGASALGSDPYLASDWIDLGKNLDNITIRLSLRVAAPSQENKTIANLAIQRFPTNGSDWSQTYYPISDIHANSLWREHGEKITFLPKINGSTSTKFRLILRPPNDSEAYFDRIVLEESSYQSPRQIVQTFGKKSSIPAQPLQDGVVNIFDYNHTIKQVLPKNLVEANMCNVSIGGAGKGWTTVQANPKYKYLISSNSQIYSLEDLLKWVLVRPTREVFSFEDVDPMIEWLLNNQIDVHGHVLVWHDGLPQWLTQGNFTPTETSQILNEHIDIVVDRFKGKIKVWDVVNEAFLSNGTLRTSSYWHTQLGETYIRQAFIRANQADPQAILLYNDFGIETVNIKSTAVLQYLTNLKNQGVPIHAVGFQTHINLNSLDMNSLRQNIKRFADAGFQVYFTEVDVALPLINTQADYLLQAKIYSQLLDACLDNPACKSFQTWGYTDRFSWIPSFAPGNGDALPFGYDYLPKPAFCALRERLQLCSH